MRQDASHAIHQRTLITTMKNEGPFILEWTAYHRLIGFDRLMVFANDCSDGSDRLLEALDAAGLIEYFDNSEVTAGMPLDPQNRAYRWAFAMPEVRNSDWVLVLDADEFLNIHAGSGRLDDLLPLLPDNTDAVGANWCVFGHGGITDFADRPVIEQFTRAAPKDLPVSFNHYGIKTLFRPEKVHRIGVHRPFFRGHYKRPESPLLWLNGSGRNVTGHYRTKRWSATPRTVGYDLVQVNHYMIRASEVFLMKRRRGTANSVDTDRINFAYFDQFNSNHEQEISITRWAEPVRARIAQIRADHPEIARLHDACVDNFRQRIDALKSELRETDPESWRRLFDPQYITREIAQQERWLANKRRFLQINGATSPTAVQAGPVVGAPASRGGGIVAFSNQNDDEHVDLTDGEAGASDTGQPQWLADLRSSDFRRGFYHSDRDFAGVFSERSIDQLIISFDNLSNVRDPSLTRDPWGYDFCRKRGFSQLGILSFQPNWFRDPALFEFLTGLRDDGFFRRFRRVALIGTSMGAYGAAAFASLAPGATVVAMSPQSTLDPARVPWEERFRVGQRQDWSGPFADAAQEVVEAERVYMFYDPLFAPDRQHAARFTSPNVLHMKTRHSGHKSALFLRRAELLSRVMEQAVSGDLTPQEFYRLYREGRRLPWYLNALTGAVMDRGRPGLVSRALRHIETTGRASMAASISRRLGVQG
jgi:hypothetical protein